MSEQNRQLAAITFIDIVDFSKLMHEDEEKAIHLLSLQKDVVYPIINSYSGNILKELGDGLLVSFDSAIQAVKCSIEIQTKVEYIEYLNYRIGIHIGDVIKKDNDVFGDGVNIASRMQNLAETGGICISQNIYDAIQNQSSIQCVSLGEKKLKGIAEKISLYKVVIPTSSTPHPTSNKSNYGFPKNQTANNITNNGKSKKWAILLGVSILCSIITLMSVFNQSNNYTENNETSIAILPFGNTIKDEDFDWLSQQFVDELTNKLLNIKTLSIKDFSQVLKAFNSMEPAKAGTIDLSLAQELGEKIHSKYILYGNYLIFDKQQIKITANLVHVKEGTILTSFQRTYDIISIMEVLDAFPAALKQQIESMNLGVVSVQNEK